MIYYIEDIWLRCVAGKDFFYPAASLDIPPFVELLAPTVRQFICNDLHYNVKTDMQSPVPKGFKLVKENRLDPACRNMNQVKVEGSRPLYHRIDPTFFDQHFESQGERIRVVRRKGYGQYALIERANRSIGVFAHRFDTAHEGGSNLWFLANKHKDHEPLSNLWDKLAERLADTALIISDGSLTNFRFLYPDPEMTAEENFHIRRSKDAIEHMGFSWRCVGFMGDRGRTLIWGIKRVNQYCNT